MFIRSLRCLAVWAVGKREVVVPAPAQMPCHNTECGRGKNCTAFCFSKPHKKLAPAGNFLIDVV